VSTARETPRAFARRRVHEFQTVPIDLFGLPVRFLNKGDAERFAGHAVAAGLRAGLIDPDKARSTANDGDPLFQHALGLLDQAERPKKLHTGRKRETNYFRDIAITMLIQELRERFELKPTASSKNGQGDCGCGIVAEAIGLSYDAVCKVWGRLGKQI
jgi:hypothetical protein